MSDLPSSPKRGSSGEERGLLSRTVAGIAMIGETSFRLNSRCYGGFSGVNCSLPLCLSVNNCSGHGQCLEADLCICDVGYTGADCSNVSCEGVNYCSGREGVF